jgi:peptidoglycan DL-endopeptidase CwlO
VLTLGPAAAAHADTPEQRLARLRAQAATLNARIEQDNRHVALLVEEYNANQVALARTRAAEARARQRLGVQEARLGRARQQLERRARAAYIHRAGPLSDISRFLGARTLHEALTTLQYQRRVIQADQALISTAARARATLAETAAELRARRVEHERITRRLHTAREAIQRRLAHQRATLARVSVDVLHAMRQQRAAAERRREAAAARYVAQVAHEPQDAEVWPVAAGVGAGAAGRAVSWALGQLGKPYRWGATGLETFDCSGLTMRAYQAAGVSLPRTSRAQWSAGRPVARNRLRPGDLLFFGGSPATIHHVAMYAGNGRMVEAPHTGARVRVVSMFRDNYVGAVRPAA